MKKMIPKEEAEYYLNLYYVDDYDEDGSLGEGEVVETEDLIFGQAYNGHISAYDITKFKTSGFGTFTAMPPRCRRG